jgi:hypothetical protein
MAKKKESEQEDAADRSPSIGTQMKSKLSQRDRNLAIKNQMIERGERKAPKVSDLRTQRERNLYLKNSLNEQKTKDDDKQGKRKT